MRGVTRDHDDRPVVCRRPPRGPFAPVGYQVKGVFLKGRSGQVPIVHAPYRREISLRRADRIPALARKGPPASQGMGPFSASIRNAISRHEPSTGAQRVTPCKSQSPVTVGTGKCRVPASLGWWAASDSRRARSGDGDDGGLRSLAAPTLQAVSAHLSATHKGI